MTTYIIKLNEYYLEWSTVVDAPICKGMNLNQFQSYYQRKYESTYADAMPDLSERLRRVEQTGTSSYTDCLDSLVSCNRAGDNEEDLTIDELITKYCPQIPNS